MRIAISAFSRRTPVRRLLVAAAAIVLALSAASGAGAQDRPLKGVALVIGNGEYEHLPALPNPENDARAIEEMLATLGFDTSMSTDRDARRLKRDLEGFVEDAEGADVAVIYYSGHGIEAGGENFLVPVDADTAALDDAGERLVPISDVLARLKATVPVTIVLLDACRTNPFPAGAAVRLSPKAPPQGIGTAGLGATRGAVALGTDGADSLGQVIGFAAEPGHAALDGDAGGNSPYAAALLRHIGAMPGDEFGTVLRMVTEEVYLKTGGRQRPWVNESLRRLLFFGGAAPTVAGAEGDILAERRRLLLTIAALPDPERRQIEGIAGSGGVPMDALYGMLAALGAQAPRDPVALEQLLRSQTLRLKDMLAERAALKSEDAEISRLAGLADQALREGALETAVGLLGDAKARVTALSSTVDQAEDDLRRKRIEFGTVYAKSAEARALAFDDAGAAEDYAQAFAQVEKWDPQAALDYKIGEAVALTEHGQYSGDKDALQRATEAGAAAMRLASAAVPFDRARSEVTYANALQGLGERESGLETLEQAIAAYRNVIPLLDPGKNWPTWSTAQNNLANTLSTIGRRVSDRQRLEDAADVYRELIRLSRQRGDELTLLKAMNNLAKALHERGEMEPGANDRLIEARTVYEQALTRVKRAQYPMLWAALQNNHANVVKEIAGRTDNRPYRVLMLVQALGSYTYAMQEWTRETAPAHWAVAQSNMAIIYQDLAWLDASRAAGYLASADEAQSSAMEVMTHNSAPMQWATFAYGRGRTRHAMGDHAGTDEQAASHYQAAAQDYRAALTVLTRDNRPDMWADANISLGTALQAFAQREHDALKAAAALQEAGEAQRTAIDFYAADRQIERHAQSLHDLGLTYVMLGERGGGAEAYRQAEAIYREELPLWSKDTAPVPWARAQAGIANALRAIGLASDDLAMLAEARRLTQDSWDTIRPYDQQYDEVLGRRIAEIDAALAKQD
ncbi:MAG: caspase family protein [Rhizobiaceae bacterium]